MAGFSLESSFETSSEPLGLEIARWEAFWAFPVSEAGDASNASLLELPTTSTQGTA
jgi:hypothetical protein